MKVRSTMNQKKEILKSIHHYQRILVMLWRNSLPDSIVRTIGVPKTLDKLVELEDEYRRLSRPSRPHK